MARPHIEFIHSRDLPWEEADLAFLPPEVDVKPLSHDSQSNDLSTLIHIPPEWAQSDWKLTSSFEFFVLSGEVTLNGRTTGTHAYCYLPSGTDIKEMASANGAVLLAFFESHDGSDNNDPSQDEVHVDCFDMAWDMMHMNPGVAYLNMGRKNLRVPDDQSGRTYLLAGFPQARPTPMRQPLERHPYAEEAFMISGDLALTNGTMTQGAYFWRPPHLWHGGMYSVNGFMMLVRTPGSNDPIIEWTKDTYDVDPAPAYQPILPDDLKPIASLAKSRAKTNY